MPKETHKKIPPVSQTGGQGTDYEYKVAAAFILNLIVGGQVPGTEQTKINEIKFQNRKRGWETDDLLVECESGCNLICQVKSTISFSQNATFQKVIFELWNDFSKQEFNQEKDKLVIITNHLGKGDKAHLSPILHWANTHSTASDFLNSVSSAKVFQDRLSVFQVCIKSVNKNLNVSDEDLWKFLKCLEIFEIDIMNPASVALSYYLSLIKLSKKTEETINETHIWNDINRLATELVKTGGSVSNSSIKEKDVVRYFSIARLEPVYEDISKLRKNSLLAIRSIPDSIGGFKIDRLEQEAAVWQALSENQFVVLTGNAGCGKSALIKGIMSQKVDKSGFLFLKGDVLDRAHLVNVFSDLGVNRPIEDIFGCMALMPEKLIIIDSFEKLLDANHDDAFRQLCTLLLERPEIKIVVTCRTNSVDLLHQRFELNRFNPKRISIPNFGPRELGKIIERFPVLNQVLSNQNLTGLLEIPKYLEITLKVIQRNPAQDFSVSSLKEFKDNLWSELILNPTQKNFPRISERREIAFSEIVINRAVEMVLFTRPSKPDNEALEALITDELIFSNDHGSYSPTHDILEDWTLIRVVEERNQLNEIFLFLEEKGNQPAFRRAFRLWVEDEIQYNQRQITELSKKLLRDPKVNQQWKDELLIAILKSADCNAFFNDLKDDLLSENGKLFYRCIQLLETSCREITSDSFGQNVFKPIGSGWSETISFCFENENLIMKNRGSAIYFLQENLPRVLHNEVGKDELLKLKVICISFLDEVEAEDQFWLDPKNEPRQNFIITFLFAIAEVCRVEIDSFLTRAHSYEKVTVNKSWSLVKFYELVLKRCVSGNRNKNLVTHHPDLVIRTCWQVWRVLNEKNPEGNTYYSSYNPINRSECWGIEDDINMFFPVNSFRVPVYQLLISNPDIGKEFIVQLLDYSVNCYLESNSSENNELESIRVFDKDLIEYSKHGSKDLWLTFRHSHLTNNAIACILSGLEKFLLEIAAKETQESKNQLESMACYLLLEPNSILTYSVFASVAMAYPLEIGSGFLPIFSAKTFFDWDRDRAFQDQSNIFWNFPENDSNEALSEKERLNNLPHRKKHLRGLQDFMSEFQLRVGSINPEIQSVLNIFWEELNEEEVIWKKTLTEMDIRKFKAEIISEESNVFTIGIQPNYDESTQQAIQSWNQENSEMFLETDQAKKLSDFIESKVGLSLEEWTQIYTRYTVISLDQPIWNKPITLAWIGLDHFYDQLDEDQKLWCLNRLIKFFEDVYNELAFKSYNPDRSYNFLEKPLGFKSLHLILKYSNSQVINNQALAYATVINYLNNLNNERELFGEYIRKVLRMHDPKSSYLIWTGTIALSKNHRDFPRYIDTWGEGHKEMMNTELEFLFRHFSNDQIVDNKFENLEEFDPNLLAVAFRITPLQFDKEEFKLLALAFCRFLIKDINDENELDYHVSNESGKIYHMLQLEAKQYLVECCLYADRSFCFELIEIIFEIPLKKDFEFGRGRHDLFEFQESLLLQIIIRINHKANNLNTPEELEEVKKNFWILWTYLFKRFTEVKKLYFKKYLLLGINFGNEVRSWGPLEGYEKPYLDIVTAWGKHDFESILMVYSSIGEKALIPNYLPLLTEILKQNIHQAYLLKSDEGKRLAKRLYENHIIQIKKDKFLMAEYLWLLDIMFEVGSTDAYFLRENVITYKASADIKAIPKI